MRHAAFWVGLSLFIGPQTAYAGAGKAGAAFLDIPVGARPAALGGAYTALAEDAYAATYNPAGLGADLAPQFSGQHLAYLSKIHYEYLSFALPLERGSKCFGQGMCPTSGIAGSIQYLGSGDVAATDENGVSIGSFSSFYASYNLAYGRSFGSKAAFGVTAKMIQAKIDDVSAQAFAADLGATYKPSSHLTLAATVTQLGSKLKFLDQADPLPTAAHLGAAYRLNSHWTLTGEGVYALDDSPSFHTGVEWQPFSQLTLRTGYRTDTLRELSALAGYSMGIGLTVWGHELGYAYLPYGKLGDTHYVSLIVKLGQADEAQRNLIKAQTVKKRGLNDKGEAKFEPEYEMLMELINANDAPVAQNRNENQPEAR